MRYQLVTTEITTYRVNADSLEEAWQTVYDDPKANIAFQESDEDSDVIADDEKWNDE